MGTPGTSRPARRTPANPFIACTAAAVLFSAAAPAADFEMGFEGFPEVVRASPGEKVTFDAYVTVTTSENESPYGAMSWSYMVGTRGGAVTAISLEGVKVSTIYLEDPDRDPSTPEIVHDPYEQDLGLLKEQGVGVVVARLCQAVVGRTGEELGWMAGSMILLRKEELMMLQPTGTQRLARITVEATAPLEGECSPVELFILDFDGVTCRNVASCGSGRPSFAHEGALKYASIKPASVRVCVTRFRRGDSNADGRVDISDVIFTLGALFLGGPKPVCGDSADATDDGVLDISDGIQVLSRLFSVGPSVVIPPPGIHDCGVDQKRDLLDCREDAGC